MRRRKYRQSKRADQQAETRGRIVEALMALHAELGPANTSIKAVAERAGVQRLTVYRYFPDDASLFRACSTRWLELHPPPDPADWATAPDADARTRAALLAFYRYYRRTEAMWRNVYRDIEVLEAVKTSMARFEGYLDRVRDDLLAAWKATGKRKQPLSVTLRHCLRFSTWQALQREKLKDTQIVDLVMGWLRTG
jgi:AcrR family transcriptional regulator